MRAKSLISAVGTVGLLAISIAAFAGAWDGFSVKGEVQITETEPSMETTATAAVLELPEPTIEDCHSKIGSMYWNNEDAYLLAKIAMAEAANQDTEGKALVILVVLNRVWSDKFPDSIKEVIYQPGQFSPVADGGFDCAEPGADCWKALDLIMTEHWDESQGALYFESKSESTWHERNLQFLFRHGDHYFYTERN